MSITFSIQGDENIKRMFDEFGQKAVAQPIKRSFKKASTPLLRAMKSSIPSEIKPTVKVLKAKPSKGAGLFMSVGFFGRLAKYVNRRGLTWDPYMLLYWFNYGTYAGRDGGHKFIAGRKAKTAARSGGIMAKRFLENAWDASKNEVVKTFETAMKAEEEKFFKERALTN